MNSIQSIFSPAITEALGWTIIHALWQGALVLIGLLILLSLLNKYSAQVRYFISFTALVIMLGWSVSTFINAYSYANQKQILRAELVNNPSYFKNHSNTVEETSYISKSIDFRFVKVRAWFQRNFPIFLTIWLIGIGLFTVRLLGGLAYNRRLRTMQLLPFEEKWMDKLKEFTSILKISKEVKAYKSPHTYTPLTLGFIKPIILFPVKAFSGLSEKEIEAIIAHELAHIVRNDYFFNIIQSVIEILFFYHPAVWSISKHIRTEREHACDDIAINITGDQVTYAKALTHAHIFSYQQENLSMAFAKKKGSLLERIKRIQKQRVMKTNISEGLIAACIIISSIFLVSFSVGNQFNENIFPQEKTKKQINPPSEPIPNPVTRPEKPPKPPKALKAKRDSLMIEVEKNIKIAKENKELSEEIEQAIEIALSEQDRDLSAEIIEDINIALNEINYGEIVQEALQEAQVEIDAAIEEINSDSLREEIRLEMKAAREEINMAKEEVKEAMRQSRQELKEANELSELDIEISELSLEAAQSGLDIASEVLKNIDIESIVKTSLEAASVAVELAGSHIESLNLDSIVEVEINAVELETERDELKREKEELKKEKEDLKKEMEQLKKEMKKMKKKLKEELKDIDKE